MKRIISFLLAIAMVITFMLPAMASNSASTDLGLENAIKAAKEKIDVPKEFTKFIYDINTYDKLNLWRLEWSDEKTHESISVTIDDNNLIRNYYVNKDFMPFEKKIPKFSEAQGLSIAEKFINKLDSKLLQQFKRTENTDKYGSDNVYSYNFNRQVNGIVYSANNIHISVNKYTGEVENYNCDYNKDTSFEDSSKIITLEQAKKAFIEKLGLNLVYNVKTENEKQVTYLAYVPKYGNKYIDAVTGNVELGTQSGTEMLYDKAELTSASMTSSNVKLTPDELEAVKGMSDVISKEDMDKKIRAINLFGIDKEFKLSGSYLNKEWRNKDSFEWFLHYSKIINKNTNESLEVSVTADAKTGEIKGFWISSSYDKNAKPIKTKEEAKAICDDVLKTLLPNKYAKLKYNDSYESYNPADSKAQNQFTFRYVRVENGVECPSEYVNIGYDNLSGKVSSMDSNWTKDLTFAASKPAISLEKAYEVLFSKIGYDVQYINDYTDSESNKEIIVPEKTSDKAVLGYFVNSSRPNIISAATGDVLNQSGEVYTSDSISDYTDIKGLKAENQIKILTQMSIKYRENELKPNAEVLQKDYFLLLGRLNDLYYIDKNASEDKAIEEMYSNLISQGIITKNEQAPNSTMTREQAARYFVKFLKLGQIAEIKGIYKADFKDANKIKPDMIGYVCLASGLKAIDVNNGYFNPKGKFTRLDALLSIYSYLNNK